MGDEKNPEKDFEKEKKKKIEKEPEKQTKKGAKTEKKRRKKGKQDFYLYILDFIGSDLRRRVSFDSVKESSKP